jgi:hypothetical protein
MTPMWPLLARFRVELEVTMSALLDHQCQSPPLFLISLEYLLRFKLLLAWPSVPTLTMAHGDLGFASFPASSHGCLGFAWLAVKTGDDWQLATGLFISGYVAFNCSTSYFLAAMPGLVRDLPRGAGV